MTAYAYKLILNLVNGERLSDEYDGYVEAMEAARGIMNHPEQYMQMPGAGEVSDVFIRNSAVFKIAVVKERRESE